MRAEIQSVFASTVAQSTKLSTFVTLQVFANMLAEHRIFFTGTK
jgi:hypothetical protein